MGEGMIQDTMVRPVFDPLRPAPGESVDLHREKLRTWAELRGPVSDDEWARLCRVVGIPPFPGE